MCITHHHFALEIAYGPKDYKAFLDRQWSWSFGRAAIAPTWTHHSEHFWTMWASTQELKDGKMMENGVCRCLQNKDKGAIRYEEIRGNTRMVWNRSIIKVIKHLESLAKLFGFQAGHWVLAIWETAKGGFMKGFFGPGLSHCKWEWTIPDTQSSWV